MARRILTLCVALCALAAVLPLAGTAGAQTTAIDRARAEARAATERLSRAEAELGRIEGELAALEATRARAEERLASLNGSIQDLVIERYMTRGDLPLLGESDINEGVKAQALARFASQGTYDSIDDFTRAAEELGRADDALTAARARQQDSLAELDAALRDVQARIRRLEEEEARRRQAEAEAARRRAAEADRSRRAAAAAPRSVPVSTGGGMVCPVAGPNSFVDTWGAPRSGGRRHRGVDMMAGRGTPVVAPVSGVVTHRGNAVGGLSFHLSGDNGHYYYGTHLARYGAAGRVSAGTVIGFVGDTGNARGIPHLHFEIHPNHGAAVNPTPATRAACG